jgi:hypothetical protein
MFKAKGKPSNQHDASRKTRSSACHLLVAGFLLGLLIINPED